MFSRQTRREFLRSSSTLAVGLGLGQIPWLAGCATKNVARAAPISESAFQELARSLRGTLLRPGAPDFARVAAPWNLRYLSSVPAAIARCATDEDIRTCLQWSQSHDVRLVARSGGHSYAGYSTTPGLLIDLSPLNALTYDATTGHATVGAGARNATVYAHLPAVGRGVTHGRCMNVGVGGLVLGGGIGFNMRRHGLLIDQLVHTELMTATGQRLRCNARENPDVFWACRGGGGGNFGINTSFTFQTFPVETLTVFSIQWTSHVDALLPAALDLLPTTPTRLGGKLAITRGARRGLTVELLGQLVGTPEEVRTMLAPLYRIAPPSVDETRMTSYWEGQRFLTEDGAPEYGHERSRYVFKPLGAQASRTILDYLRRWPRTQAQATWKMFLTGGAVAEIAPGATAYLHRTAIMLSSIDLGWTEHDSAATLALNDAWLAEFHDAMKEFTSDQCYQNFIDDAQKDYLRAYYGSNLERLVDVKRRVDPANVFHYPQSIPPPGPAGTPTSSSRAHDSMPTPLGIGPRANGRRGGHRRQ